MKNSRLKYSKICRIYDSNCDNKYLPKYEDSVKKSLPSVLSNLGLISNFIGWVSSIFASNIRSTEYVNKYTSLSDDSLNNKIIN